jgi:raffinose/stachyose/melibiose transport system permease protein
VTSAKLQVTGRSRRTPRAVRIGLVIGTALVLVAFLFPVLFVVNTSLKSQQDYFANISGLTTSFAWTNFLDVFAKVDFGRYLLNSAAYTIVAATVGTSLSLLIAFPVSRRLIRGAGVWNGVFVVMLFLPITLVAQYQMLIQLGLYNSPVGYGLLLTSSVGISPLLITGYLRSIPLEMDESAALDGVGYFRYLFTFIVRLATPALVTAFILQALTAWNEVILAKVVLAVPENYPASVGLLAFATQYSVNWPLLSAATVVVALPIIVLYASLQRYFVAGALQGAFKD